MILNINLRIWKSCMDPVSYTHLDVYKRQHYRCWTSTDWRIMYKITELKISETQNYGKPIYHVAIVITHYLYIFLKLYLPNRPTWFIQTTIVYCKIMLMSTLTPSHTVSNTYINLTNTTPHNREKKSVWRSIHDFHILRFIFKS